LDVQLNVPADECGTQRSSLQMLPPDERRVNLWANGVYYLDGDDGFEELEPTPFLISYWGMRYFNLLEA
jgi:hypothetical protein